MNDRDTIMLSEAYTKMYTEGMKDTLGAVAMVVLSILGGKNMMQHAGAEYTQGMPNLQVPDDMTARRNLDKYLSKLGWNSKLMPKHLQALEYMVQHAPDQDIRDRAAKMLAHQKNL